MFHKIRIHNCLYQFKYLIDDTKWENDHAADSYVNNGIDTQHVGEIEEAWLHNIASRITAALRENKEGSIELLNDEVSEDYQVSVKRAIVDFVLKDTNVSDAVPEETTAERKELDVVPKPWAASEPRTTRIGSAILSGIKVRPLASAA